MILICVAFLPFLIHDLAFLPKSDQQLDIDEVAWTALEYTPSGNEGNAEAQGSTQIIVHGQEVVAGQV